MNAPRPNAGHEARAAARPAHPRDAARQNRVRAGSLPARLRDAAYNLRLLAVCALAVCALACAAARPTDPAAPRANEPPYPVTLAAAADRREQALGNWVALARAAGLSDTPPAPELQPATATVRTLPAGATSALLLPLVEIKDGGQTKRGAEENAEEATRESLRRFITGATDLLGVRLQDLSLVEIAGDAAGVRVARYRQRPFPFPLRGGYGGVEIRFTADRRVVGLASTALPDTERLARALTAARTRAIPAEQIAQRVAGRAFKYGPAEASQTRTVAAGEQVEVRQLVVYPVPRAGDPGTLDLRLAWETALGADLFAYIDAVTGETIAAEPQPRA
jgi:hypothetical protein